ncbi:MAG: SGNH/GDSL hydrolase family protein [Opitutales bacterium]
MSRVLLALVALCCAGLGAAESPDVAKLRARMAEKRPMTWLFTGDSITHGALHTKGWRGFTEIFAERIRFELNRRSDMVVNTGISGDTTAGIVAALDWRLTRFQPDVTFVMFGMNDSVIGPDLPNYEANLRKVVAEARKNGGIAVLMRVNPCLPGSAQEKRHAKLEAYMDAVAKVAADEKLILVDHWADWRKDPKSIAPMMNDEVHPNARGHQEMAIRILQAVGLHDPRSFTGRITAPAQGK